MVDGPDVMGYFSDTNFRRGRDHGAQHQVDAIPLEVWTMQQTSSFRKGKTKGSMRAKGSTFWWEFWFCQVRDPRHSLTLTRILSDQANSNSYLTTFLEPRANKIPEKSSKQIGQADYNGGRQHTSSKNTSTQRDRKHWKTMPCQVYCD